MSVRHGRRSVLSMVVSVFNEEERIYPLYEKIHGSCDPLGKPYEIIFVDDGSQDRTFAVLEDIHMRDGRAKIVRFRKNYGQTAVMAAGFRAASGPIHSEHGR